MRKAHLYTTGLLFITSMTACSSGTGTTNAADSTALNPGDSAISTSTTTTTVHRRYAGSFAPQTDVKYLDLRTQKQVAIRIDTLRGQIINTETNEPLDLFVDPVKHDTIYGQTGTVVNNYVIKDESGYRVDTVRINTVEVRTVTATPEPTMTGDGKYKEKENKTKLKTDDQKIKVKNGVMKVKDR